MEQPAAVSQQGYDPSHLLDALIAHMRLKNDAALSRALDVAPPVISKIRHRLIPVGASMLIRMHEASGLSIHELRALMGDRRRKCRLSNAKGKPKPVDNTHGHALRSGTVRGNQSATIEIVPLG